MPAVKAYYNEYDPYCAEWLRNLIKAGHLPKGDVDERSITEVEAHEIKEYDQWHFFAGLGGWGYAARLAEIGETSGVLTGSPPCQPFSSAGKRQGYADERHLAPVWLNLVAALRPAWVFGEQVAAAIRKDDWLDDLLDALETEGYTTGASVLPACGVGAPHIRQRLWFVGRLADADGEQCNEGLQSLSGRSPERAGSDQQPDGVGDTDDQGSQEHRGSGNLHIRKPNGTDQGGQHINAGVVGGLADTEDRNGRGGQHNDETERQQGDGQLSGHNRDSGLADPTISGRETWSGDGIRNAGSTSETPTVAHDSGHGRGSANQAGWDDPDWLYCRDGKWRPVEPGTFPLADGIPARVGRLRAYGNAIVPQVAAKIIVEAMRG